MQKHQREQNHFIIQENKLFYFPQPEGCGYEIKQIENPGKLIDSFIPQPEGCGYVFKIN